MSRRVEVAAEHASLDRAEAFAMVTDFHRHARMSEAVKSVTVEPQPDGTLISHWEVNFRKGVLVWSEVDEIDPATQTLRFRKRDGDPEAFEGTWSVRDGVDGGCVIAFEAEFDIGIPTMRRMLEPLAARTMQDNIVATMRGVFGDSVTISVAGADTTGDGLSEGGSRRSRARGRRADAGSRP